MRIDGPCRAAFLDREDVSKFLNRYAAAAFDELLAAAREFRRTRGPGIVIVQAADAARQLAPGGPRAELLWVQVVEGSAVALEPLREALERSAPIEPDNRSECRGE